MNNKYTNLYRYRLRFCLLVVVFLSISMTILIVSSNNVGHLPQKNAITYITHHPTVGRLGDRMKLCSIAYTIAALHDIDFIYNPFNNFDVFVLHSSQKWCSEEKERAFERSESLAGLAQMPELQGIQKEGNKRATLYELQGFRFPEIGKVPRLKGIRALSHFLMRHPDIKKELISMFSPTIELKDRITLRDGITVAVHVRKGNGWERPLAFNQRYNNYSVAYTESVFDTAGLCLQERTWKRNYGLAQNFLKNKDHDQLAMDVQFPLKFPPEQYYIDQIVLLSELLKDQQLYIHIFSDSSEIEELTRSIECAVKERLENNGLENKERLIFSFHNASSGEIGDILSDLYAMSKCDCLIRPGSQLSEMSQILGNHAIVLSPITARIQGNNLVIDKVRITRLVPVLSH
jgi:hypothetical protein